MIDAVRHAHSALTASMVVLLEGPVGVGAMTAKAAKQTLEWLEEGHKSVPLPPERTLTFEELLAAIQATEKFDNGTPVRLDRSEAFYLRELNRLRDDIEHPKFMYWSYALGLVDLSVVCAADLVHRIVGLSPQRYVKRELERCAAALQRILRITDPSP